MNPQAAKGEDDAAVMATLENWAALWSSHDIDALLSLFSEDCVYEDVTFSSVNRGKAELGTFAEGIFAAFPDFKVQLTSHFGSKSWAGMEWIISGTHRGDMPGMPATNKSFSVRGATILEMNSGKIRRNSDYWDLATFLKQIDLMPSA